MNTGVLIEMIPVACFIDSKLHRRNNKNTLDVVAHIVENVGVPLRHILGQIAARPRSTLTPVSNHGFTDPLAAESLKNMNKKFGFDSVGFLTDGF